MDPAPIRQRSVPVIALDGLDQHDWRRSGNDISWTQYSNSPDSLAHFDPRFFSPIPRTQMPSSSSYSWDDSPEYGDLPEMEDDPTNGNHNLPTPYVTPDIQTLSEQSQLSSNAIFDCSKPFQSSNGQEGMAYSWTPEENKPERDALLVLPRRTRRTTGSSHCNTKPSTDSKSSLRMVDHSQIKPVGPSAPQASMRKRVSPLEDQIGLASPSESITSDCESGKSAKQSGSKRKKPRRTAHNAIERRYRSRLNDKIAGLRDCIPNLRARTDLVSGGNPEDGPVDGLGITVPAQKRNKAEVLTKATEYVKYLENRNRELEETLQRTLALSTHGSPTHLSLDNLDFPNQEQRIQDTLAINYRSESRPHATDVSHYYSLKEL